mgnify:CR=1 FL=1|tara:strand:- start:182 stop:403 length:222 start_codon:yes stop_codon:yes gene_type:complete
MDQLLKELGWKKTTGIAILAIVILLSIKALIVQYSYNRIAPKIAKDWNGVDNLPNITFVEALLLTILAIALIK